jgi:D-apionolactonase
VPLEVGVHLGREPDQGLNRLADIVLRYPARVCRWLIFHDDQKEAAKWVKVARHSLLMVSPGVPVGGGTPFNFAELNRNRPPAGSMDVLTFAVSPQVHARDDLSIMENLEAQADVVRTIRDVAPGVPVSVGPVTLRPQGELTAASVTIPGPVAYELPPVVDPRQAGLVGACWTLGSLKYLAEAGAEHLTYFETTGWLGVMERETGSPLPERLRAMPGGVFPLYHVLADVGEFAGGEVLASELPLSLNYASLVLRKGSRIRILLANLTHDHGMVVVRELPAGWRLSELRNMEAITVEKHGPAPDSVTPAMLRPEEFRATWSEVQTRRRLGNDWKSLTEKVEFFLSPYGVSRIDLKRVTDE